MLQSYPAEKDNLTLRIVTPDDAAHLLEIYAPYVRETAITFEYDVPTLEDFRARIASTLEKYPYIVAEQGGKVCGYAYVGPFKTRAAYDHAIETSVYVDRTLTHLGVGTLLYNALENVLLAQNVFSLNACIALPICEDDPFLTNGSVLFHEKRGYSVVGHFAGCAYKFNRWYDMVWMQKLQGAHEQRLQQFLQAGSDTQTAPFVPFVQLDPARVRKMLALAAQGGNEDERSRTDSAGAVVFRSLTPEHLEVLMIEMKKNRWSFPKGHIMEGELKEEAALREVREETGVEARVLPDFCYRVASARKTDKRDVYFFAAEYAGGNLHAQEEEIDETQWVSADEAPHLISFESDKAMFYAALEKYRSYRSR